MRPRKVYIGLKVVILGWWPGKIFGPFVMAGPWLQGCGAFLSPKWRLEKGNVIHSSLIGLHKPPKTTTWRRTTPSLRFLASNGIHQRKGKKNIRISGYLAIKKRGGDAEQNNNNNSDSFCFREEFPIVWVWVLWDQQQQQQQSLLHSFYYYY